MGFFQKEKSFWQEIQKIFYSFARQWQEDAAGEISAASSCHCLATAGEISAAYSCHCLAMAGKWSPSTVVDFIRGWHFKIILK